MVEHTAIDVIRMRVVYARILQTVSLEAKSECLCFHLIYNALLFNLYI